MQTQFRRRQSTIVLFFLAVLFVPIVALAQNRVLTGTVQDASTNQPLASASISVVGKPIGAATDANGRFVLEVPVKAQVTISYAGYVSQTVNVPASGELSIRLELTVKPMEEVVVIGYGQARKKDLTGSIVQIRPDRIADENPKTVQDILRGTPGLSVGFDASAKGGGSMQIRGQRSLFTAGGHNDPLLIVDGMIFYGELSEINPDDIAQIDILKDASAAAVYGAKSANGVIIISTRKGQKGKPRINLTSNFGVATMGANRKVFGPEGYLQYRHDWYIATTYGVNTATGAYEPYRTPTPATGNINKPGFYDKPTQDILDKYGITIDQWRAYTTNTVGASDNEIWAKRLIMQDVTLANYLAGKTFDWYDHSFQAGLNQDYNVSVSGANDRMNYYMSFGYLSNEGVAVGNEYSAVRANLKLEGKVTDWLDISGNVNFQNRTDGDLAVDWGNQITTNSPFANYKDSTGKLMVHPMGDMTNNKGYNYDFNRRYVELEKGYTVLNTIWSAKVKLPFNITYSFNAAPRFQFFYDRYFESSQHPDWPALTHGANREQSKRFDWSLNNTINWERSFKGGHRVAVTLVQEAEKRQFWMDRIEARNLLPTDALGFHETRTGDVLRSSFNTDDSKETADGMLARAFYTFGERYMVTASVRRDGYSAFGTSNPRATFISTALAWTFTNEKFFHWSPLNMGKLRLSWGENGNRALDNPYIALADLGSGAGATQGYIDASGNYIQYRYMSVNRLANPNLRWEKTTAINAGLDFAFFNSRLTGTVDYYIMPTTDMIMNQTLPGFSGVGSITTNLGEVENKGIEITINSQNFKNNNFTWNTTLGFSKMKNAIKHLYYVYENVLDASGNVIGTREVNDVTNRWFIGRPISGIWDYRVTGIWQADEAAEALKYGQRPGDPKVANNYTADDKVNTDGSITPVYNDKDKEFLGQTAPPVMWSLRNDFTFFKNLSFSFNIYSYWGHKSLSGTYLNQDNGTSQVTNNANSYDKDYWTLENASDVYARLDAKGPAGVTSPARLFNRSFIRLDNMTVGYTVKTQLLSRWKIEKLRVYGTVRNVAVWSKDKNWQYWDIETGGLAPRIFTAGLNVTF